MKKYLIIIIALLLLVLFGFLGYAWTLGAVEEVAPLSVHVHVVSGSAEVKPASSETYVRVNTDTDKSVATGDTVKASESSVVEIVWGDQGVTRLENGSELVIEQAPELNTDETSAIKLKLLNGSVWNRMVKLLDIDKPMQVRAGDVVATVRGTTYGIGLNQGSLDVFVDDSVVAVEKEGQGEQLIADKQRLRFAGSSTTIDEFGDDTWLKDQQEKDMDFDQRYQEWIMKRAEKRTAKTKGKSQGMVRLGERMRMITAGEAKAEKEIAYLKRLLALSVSDPEHADDYLKRVQERLSKIKNKRVLREFHNIQSFLRRTELDRQRAKGIKPASSTMLKAMRQRRLAMGDFGLQRLYLQALEIDEDIDELLYMSDERRDASITVASLLARIDEVDKAASSLSESERELVNKKTTAMRKRLERWFELLSQREPQEVTPIEEPLSTSTTPIIPATTGGGTVIKPPTTTTTPKPVPVARVYQRIELIPSPSVISIKGSSTVKAYGVRTDGGVDEITSSVRFSLRTGAMGSMSANVFTAAFAGTATVDGTFVDPQGSRTASVTILVNAPVTVDPNALVSVAIVTTSPLTVACGSSLPIKVMGTYGDGSKKDLTLMSQYATSDAKLGYATEDKIYVFCPLTKSSVTITAFATDAGVKKSGSLTVTIEPDPISNTGGARPGRTNPILY